MQAGAGAGPGVHRLARRQMLAEEPAPTASLPASARLVRCLLQVAFRRRAMGRLNAQLLCARRLTQPQMLAGAGDIKEALWGAAELVETCGNMGRLQALLQVGAGCALLAQAGRQAGDAQLGLLSYMVVAALVDLFVARLSWRLRCVIYSTMQGLCVCNGVCGGFGPT